ncbi:hypothetical protein RDWZM_010316 [Blomia tropicalis]|uniref:Lethal giant larvae homologue 2 domain-containing protein n=1 Tax=Blomia tropicalis TaxID=40697 RepID=A0A9Q0RJZ5_BLOTA|nr:hypothetical protein RDWZM_010316 [Blomia tropicalis]
MQINFEMPFPRIIRKDTQPTKAEKMVEPKRSEKGKKSGFFRGMLDGLRSTVGQPSTAAGVKAILDAEVEELLKPSNFTVKTVVRHGFPYQPTAIAFDPVQRLIAIGTKNGSLRILGRPGVDISVRHVTEFAVIQIAFIINEGQLITICADDSIHMWNLRSKKLEIQQTLKFTKERITYCHLSFQSKWLYLGTERGNTYVVNIDTFSLSGYVINWNKAIELSRKTHPGCIFHLSDCPIDSNKLLIGYESGSIVLWDLRNKCADFRYAYTEGIQSMSWHSEGRQFICSHNDGSISTWNVKAGTKPSTIYPHSKMIATDHRPEPCNPIPKVEWRTVRNSDAYIIFSGGMPMESNGNNSLQMLTVIHGKSTTVLEMEHDIVDFITLCDSPYEADYSDPYAIVVLLDNDLVVVDLQTPGYPCFQNPYPMDLHESPVTYCYYLANCPPDLIRAFFMVGHKQTKRSGFSEREWPINGGEWGNFAVSYPEIIITGHADGSVKFWDATGVNLQVLYRMKTAKLFEKPKLSQQSASMSNAMETFEDLFAIEYICFVPETRSLCLAGASSQVITFRFVKTETSTELNVLVVPMNYDDFDPTSQSDLEIQSGMQSLLNQPPDPQDTSAIALRVKMGHHKRIAGFQPELVCISPWIDRRTPPYRITSMTHNVHANLYALRILINEFQPNQPNDVHRLVLIPKNWIVAMLIDVDRQLPKAPIPPPRTKRRTKVNVIVKTLDTEHINSNESLTSNMTDNSSISSQNDLETKTDNDLKQSTAIMDPIDVAMERLERNQCLEKETCDNIVVSHQDHQPPTIRKDSDQSQTIGNMVGDERFRTIKRKFIDLRNDDQQSELVSPTVVGKLFSEWCLYESNIIGTNLTSDNRLLVDIIGNYWHQCRRFWSIVIDCSCFRWRRWPIDDIRFGQYRHETFTFARYTQITDDAHHSSIDDVNVLFGQYNRHVL